MLSHTPMALQYGTPGGASRGPALEAARSPGTGRHQSVVSVPHARFIAMLTYQAELVGIQMQITRERSMGKARFLDALKSQFKSKYDKDPTLEALNAKAFEIGYGLA